MSEVMNQSAEVKDLFAALSKAQAEIKGAVKDSENPFFKSNYADLASVWDACRAPLAKNGLCIIQTTEHLGELGICVVTTLGHSSGQFYKGTLPISASKLDPQGIGSAISYTRRYALSAMVGVFQIDDDGEAAQNRAGSNNSKPGAKAESKAAAGPVVAPVGSIAREKPMTRVEIGMAIDKECARIKCDPTEKTQWISDNFGKDQKSLTDAELMRFLAIVQGEPTPAVKA